MLDIHWMREHQQDVQRIAKQKGIEVSIEEVLRTYDERKQLQQQIDEERAKRNQLSQEIGKLKARSDTASHAAAEERMSQVRQLNDGLQERETLLKELDVKVNQLLLLVPNMVSPDSPIGKSDQDNVRLKQVGTPPTFAFEARDHVELGSLHDMIDMSRGVKMAGTRHYVLKGTGVLLHRAVQQLAMDYLQEQGFTLMDVPLMVRGEAMTNTAFFPLGQDQTYQIASDDKWLVGTSEVPLISYYANEIVDVKAPIRLAAASNCFRSEVGSAGRDVYGLYRVHQFAKVEQVVLCEADPDLSEEMLQEITSHAEQILHLLELPYQQMAVCTGDMSQKTYKQYDLETWMPSRNSFGETHSSSNLHDFQARRAQIRYRDQAGKLRYCHTLNNTAVATPRILIPLLENHQQEDGTIRIPLALQRYMNGMKELVPAIAQK
ncbi:serine--tRNA ligase [Paenibacillus sp. 1001270B_150601_E10]|uniref:serine--tRNA ligase n=1 Tax=Paenibacillus sp. 1001270B_150601_E10 TaxID=2787079 RepID=UPI00189FD10D|nr:serine--tRNA ligase [Paenibacillus sp. 1001270B_150601_E10]